MADFSEPSMDAYRICNSNSNNSNNNNKRKHEEKKANKFTMISKEILKHIQQSQNKMKWHQN